jgi:dihydroneopterin aldolase
MSNDSGEDIYWPSVMNSWDASIAIGQPPARISVRNLQTTIRVGTDAWGREGKVQPVLISATVSLRKPFDNASVRDTVNASTIHYGTLSKAILEAAQEFHDKGGKSTKLGELSTVKDLMNHIAGHLTDRSLSGRYLEFFGASVGRRDKPLLESSVVSSLELEVTLPKALLNSTTGVSRCSTAALNGIIGEILHNYAQEKLDGHYGISIVLRDLQVSTLIGVNSNERRAKQLVIANIEIDVWIMKQDVYNELEEIAVKVS